MEFVLCHKGKDFYFVTLHGDVYRGSLITHYYSFTNSFQFVDDSKAIEVRSELVDVSHRCKSEYHIVGKVVRMANSDIKLIF